MALEAQGVWQPGARAQTEAATTLSFLGRPHSPVHPAHLAPGCILDTGQLVLSLQGPWAPEGPAHTCAWAHAPGCHDTSEPHLYCLHTLPLE